MKKSKTIKKGIKKELKRTNLIKIDLKWFFKILLIAFIISLAFSSLSEVVLNNVNIIIGIIIIIIFIILGIIFDMVGVAVAAADEKPFHSMSSRKVKGAKLSVRLKRNADKVSTICNDVIGDICGIVSGSGGAVIAISLAAKYDFNVILVSLLVTSLISGITVGGKALEKSYAINNSNEILYNFAKIINIFVKE